MRNFFAIFRIVVWSDYAFDGVLENEIRQLVAGEQDTDQGSAICGENQDFSCEYPIIISTWT